MTVTGEQKQQTDENFIREFAFFFFLNKFECIGNTVEIRPHQRIIWR